MARIRQRTLELAAIVMVFSKQINKSANLQIGESADQQSSSSAKR
jgi:hypothetical protein